MRATAGGFPVREGRAQSHCPEVPFQGRGAVAEQSKSSPGWSHKSRGHSGDLSRPVPAERLSVRPWGSMSPGSARCRCQLAGSHMASSPACGMPEPGQRWAARAARAAACPSTDQGHREGVIESRAARCIPCFHIPVPRTPAELFITSHQRAQLSAPDLVLSGEAAGRPHSPHWGAACALAGT